MSGASGVKIDPESAYMGSAVIQYADSIRAHERRVNKKLSEKMTEVQSQLANTEAELETVQEYAAQQANLVASLQAEVDQFRKAESERLAANLKSSTEKVTETPPPPATPVVPPTAPAAL